MSFVIPGIAVADVPKFAWKTYHKQLDMNPPVINVLETVFEAIGGVKLLLVDIIHDNTAHSVEDIDILLTIDGVERLYDGSVTGALTAANGYAIHFGTVDSALPGNVPWLLDITDIGGTGYGSSIFVELFNAVETLGFPLSGHDIKLEIRQTTTVDAGQRIRVNVAYEVLEAV